MGCPAFPPDLNSVEHVWNMLGRQVAAHQTPSTSLQDCGEHCLMSVVIFVKYNSNTRVTDRLDKITLKVVPAVHDMDTLGEEAPGLVVETIFNRIFDLIIVKTPPFLESFLE
ncbi:hypothetical protein TNCV_596061 [Trichonephila clavipes]|nr:hypothetical protein TNCV_596061 [Trichonephila clavipes]